MKTKGVKSLVTISLFLFSSMVFSGEIYKWMDADGKVHYGDRPKNTETAQQLKIRTKPGSDLNQEERPKKREGSLEVLKEEGKEKNTDQALLKKRNFERAKKCTESKTNLSQYKKAGYLYKLDDSGERQVLEGDDYAAALKAAQDAVDDWCRS